MASSVRQWWRRAAAALKDRRSLLLARVRPRRSGSSSSSWHPQHREVEAAVIRATSHEDRWMDYRAAARVFAWARSSPCSLRPVMWSLARRARRTRCWVVALKSLMLAHGLLLRSGAVVTPRAARAGRVPFELADFRDRSSSLSSAKSLAFSAFVRAYFRFLDYRSLFAAQEDTADGNNNNKWWWSSSESDSQLDRIAKKQFLLELLLQIRPCGDGMEVPLVLEAMDCALVDIFQVYGEICTGIARFLVSGAVVAAGGGSGKTTTTVRGKKKAAGVVKVLWRAAEQSAQLSSYFDLCRGLGVANARKLPARAFVRLKHDDVRDLERILTSSDTDTHGDNNGSDEAEAEGMVAPAEAEVKDAGSRSTTSTPTTAVVTTTTEWVAFDDEEKPSDGGVVAYGYGGGHVVSDHWNPFVAPPLDGHGRESVNLIEL